MIIRGYPTIGQLAGPQSMDLPHDRLEDMLAEQGRELLRLLLQAHLDLRADRERDCAQRLRGTGAGMTGADGTERRRLECGIIGCWPRCSGR